MPHGAEPIAGRAAPTFTVLLATFQRATIVERSMRSVLGQTDPDLELIVIDDDSTDGTADVVAGVRDDRVRVIRHPVNQGVSAAWNSGLAEAGGRYVVFLGSDDELLPDALAVMRTAWDAETEPAVGQQVFRAADAATGAVIGALVGEGITLDYLDLLCRRRDFGGDFAGAHRRDAFPHPAFDADLRGFEGLGWLRMRSTWLARIHRRSVYLVHRDRPEQRLSRVDSRIARAANLAEGYRRILDEHGAALAEHCRAELHATLRRAVIYLVVSGQRRAALRMLSSAVRRYGPWPEAAALSGVIAAGRLPTTVALRAYDRVLAR